MDEDDALGRTHTNTQQSHFMHVDDAGFFDDGAVDVNWR
jgi:hypothetical protein